MATEHAARHAVALGQRHDFIKRVSIEVEPFVDMEIEGEVVFGGVGKNRCQARFGIVVPVNKAA